MSDRKDFHYRQRVTEAELDGAFNDLEVADHNLAIDYGLTGLTSGLVAGEHTPNNLSVDVSSGTAYDQAGQRIRVPSVQTVDLSVDNGGVTTAVTTPGNSKVVSLFVKFKRVLSDPRIDGNSDTVYFVRAEGFEFFVKQGTEAATGSEIAPSLESDKLLIADVKRTQGVSAIVNAHINPYTSNRRQDTFVVAGSPFVIRRGTIAGAISDVIAIANQGATDIAAEATARASGDAATLATAEAYTDAETSARVSAVSAALATAEAYTDAETSARTSAVSAALATAEAYTDAETARAEGVEATLGSSITTETSRAEAAEALLIPLTQRASANGVATLDAGTKIPVAQIPMTLIAAYRARGNAQSDNSTVFIDHTSLVVSVLNAKAGDILVIDLACIAGNSAGTGQGQLQVVVVDPGVIALPTIPTIPGTAQLPSSQIICDAYTVVTAGPTTCVVKVQFKAGSSSTVLVSAGALLRVLHYRP